MFGDIEGMIQKVTTGEIDRDAANRTAGEQVQSTDHAELTQHVETAAANAQLNGQPDVE
jgi:hypothetical protein